MFMLEHSIWLYQLIGNKRENHWAEAKALPKMLLKHIPFDNSTINMCYSAFVNSTVANFVDQKYEEENLGFSNFYRNWFFLMCNYFSWLLATCLERTRYTFLQEVWSLRAALTTRVCLRKIFATCKKCLRV